MSEIIAFSSPERLLINLCQTMLESSQPALAGLLSTKVQDLELLASIVGRSSSLTSDLGLSKEVRSLGTLAQKLINQEEAVKSVSNALREYRAGLSKKTGPIGTFLFVGPTGVGKT
ncbi:MAG: type VI secretion system ATPase TssH, partial [Spirochaetia bacterium]|nr:type VI secretion system ATPase TssH [Spirochaetia bacterium]